MKKVKVIVVGCGNMGSSHARAYDKLDEFEIVGIVDANPKAVEAFNASIGKQYPYFSDFDEALAKASPDAVAICTYPASHEPLAVKAMEAAATFSLKNPFHLLLKGR